MIINQHIKLIAKTYLLVLPIFTVFRVILFFLEIDKVDLSSVGLSTIVKSFVMGIRFDVVISSYILFLPALVLLTLDLFGNVNGTIKRVFFYWIFVFFSIGFAVSSADIPYFIQFYDRFTIGAFEWIENFDFVVSMIFQEPKYFIIVFPFLIIEYIFYVSLKRIFTAESINKKPKTWINIALSLSVLLLVFAGIRGRLQNKSPIRIGTAYFSNNSFLNKLGLNPSFTLIKSYLDSKKSRNLSIKLISSNLAKKNVQEYLSLTHFNYSSPIARKIEFEKDSCKKHNIVLILMESMSAAKMKRHGNKHRLTPFLDSLSNNSLYFENIYTAGKHTFNGIFSTLYSFPAIYRQHTMKQIRLYDGMSSTLLKNGYSTTYFTTHDGQFDNVEGFLRANDFQKIISQSNYPISEVKTTLGVPDDYMFRYSIPVINKLAESNKPFFVTFMTASDHGPYYIPDYFEPKARNMKQKVVEYADWSLKKFIEACSKEKWFDNTLFVFVADHGAPLNPKYDISLNYFHSPLLIYGPKIINKAQTYREIGSQIDVYPTIMGLLKIPYINNTLGIDLLKEKRKYAIINDDDKIGILDTTYFCIMKKKSSSLYKYRNSDLKDYSSSNKQRVTEMTEYAKSNMQVFQDMILKGEQHLKTKNMMHLKKNASYF